MIIKRKEARKLTKEKLAELATRYANDFARKLGSDEQVTVKPGQVICDPKEAMQFFRQNLNFFVYLESRRKIRNGSAFFNKILDTVYTPIVELYPYAKFKVSIIKGDEKNLEDYVAIDGFFSELGHLVGRMLFGEKTLKSAGLGEALDLMSTLNGINFNVDRMWRKKKGCNPRKKIKENLTRTSIRIKKDLVRLFDAMLFGGDAAAIHVLGELGFETKEMKAYLETRKDDYIYQRHYDGYKIMFQALKDNDLKTACKRLGEVLARKDVNNTIDALRALDMEEREIGKYRHFLTCDTVRRARNVGWPLVAYAFAASEKVKGFVEYLRKS